MMKRSLSMTLAGLLAAGLHAQLVVSTTQTPSQLLQDVLLGSGITVSNVEFNGVLEPATPQPGSGAFLGEDTNLGIPAGIILASSFAPSIAGPASNQLSDDIGNNGNDPDLESIVGGNITNYSILEFDFVPVGDSVKFKYVFASEEYPNFVCSFNDAFGFFLSGPGIAGPYSNGAINIAVLPDEVTPVTISNVNGGQNNDPEDPFCPAVNPEYYVNNSAGTTIAYNGMTTVLTALAAVQCGQTYHIKLAIADAGGGGGGDFDTAYDSGVFLEAGSFTSAPFVPQLTPGPGIVGNSIFESCFPMSLSYVRLGDIAEADTFQVTYTGTFTNGVDIEPAFPEVVIFPAGVSSIPFTFNAPIDVDVNETIIITVVSTSDCTGEEIENVFNFFIQEAPVLTVAAAPFQVSCGGAVEISPVITGGYGVYTYDWGDGNTDSSYVVAPLSDTVYTVIISDLCGLVGNVDVPVTVIPSPNPFSVVLVPSLTAQGSNIQESCYEVTMDFLRSGPTLLADTVYITFEGTATEGEDYIGIPVQVIFPAGVASVGVPVVFPQDPDGLESLTLVLGDVSICNGGFSEMSYTFSINQAPALVAVGSSPTIPCGGSITLVPITSGGYAPFTYAWTGGSSAPTLVVGPTQATVYTATLTDTCGTTATATFNVDLLPPAPMNMAIIGPSTVTEACQGTSINIIRPSGVQGELVVNMSYAGTAQNGEDFTWPATRIIGEDLLNVIFPFDPLEDGVADDDEEAIITASFTDACGRTVTTSVTVTILDAPVIGLSTFDETVECGPDSLLLTATASGGFGGLDLVWSTGDTGPATYVQMIADGTYTVTATDACGRTATATATVSVDCEIIIPNVFTPNGDGVNDRFDIDGILSTQNTVKVFNRWGQLVFDAKNYRNTWSANGVPDGTYYYEVLVDRDPEPRTGHLTILRNDW